MIGQYLLFNRNCAEALEVYANAFNGKISGVTKYGDMPPDPNFAIAENDRELVLNSRLEIAGMEIMCADSGRITSGDNMYISFTSVNTAQVQRAWDILKQDGHVYKELTPTFFAELHGSLQDRFGINWMFSAMKQA